MESSSNDIEVSIQCRSVSFGLRLSTWLSIVKNTKAATFSVALARNGGGPSAKDFKCPNCGDTLSIEVVGEANEVMGTNLRARLTDWRKVPGRLSNPLIAPFGNPPFLRRHAVTDVSIRQTSYSPSYLVTGITDCMFCRQELDLDMAERLSGRYQCPNCNAQVNLKSFRPRVTVLLPPQFDERILEIIDRLDMEPIWSSELGALEFMRPNPDIALHWGPINDRQSVLAMMKRCRSTAPIIYVKGDETANVSSFPSSEFKGVIGPPFVVEEVIRVFKDVLPKETGELLRHQ